MLLYLVEKKDTDLFTLYDPEGLGVCCCSLYTLRQLKSLGVVVKGYYETSDGKSKTIEVGLDGKSRVKKAPVICTDLTKRSASTIMKGLDEKHYPRVKQNRSGIKGIFPIHTLVDVTYQERTVRGVILSDYSLALLDGTEIPYSVLHCNKNIKVVEVSSTSNAQSAIAEFIRIHESRLEKQQMVATYKKKLAKLEDELYAERKKIPDAILAINCAFRREEVQGNECVTMSTEGCTPETKYDKTFAIALLQKTNRPIYYKHNDSTKRQVDKARAISILKEYSLSHIDIEANSDYILIHSYALW